ncbi:MAG TPA: cbb3-type cytochrome c oxidase subunit 3 [Aurantimonas sp.]|jgi:cytochrome c oxidase cbb3-type subunit 4|nr:cbb3-type cytochrome c oxidase subunit 3 [Aurantimonas sp.]
MDLDYQTMRTFADSWALLAMVVFFVGVVIWVLRPGGRKSADDAANIPFKDED